MSEDFPVSGELRPGSLIAGYRIESRLGSGGMAVVYRARDERLGRMIALKVMASEWALDEEFRHRFVAESRAAAQVDDPHVIPVYEAGAEYGRLFIAMRLVAGTDLRGVLRREGALPAARVIELLAPVASALDAAHAAGLVHRDVKPGNILVDERLGRPDYVYLADFGLSKGVSAGASLTGPGTYLGTPTYSAPEQVQGNRVDGRADQYALACVAFELLTGRPPYEREQPMAVLLAHLSATPPSLVALRPELPAAADRVISRALAKRPEQRYGSCRDFADALAHALGQAAYGSGGSTALVPDADERRPTRRPRRRRRLVALIALGCAVLAAGVTIPELLSHRGPQATAGTGTATGTASASAAATRTVPTAAMTPKPYASLGPDPGVVYQNVTAVAFEPGSTRLAVAKYSGQVSVWDTTPDPQVDASFADPETMGVTSIAFRADGALATGDGGGSAYLWDAPDETASTAGLTATLTGPVGEESAGPDGGEQVTSVAFASDGTLAVGYDGGNIYLWNSTDLPSSDPAPAATLTTPSGIQGLESIAYGHGDTLAASYANGSVYLWDTASEKVTAIIRPPAGSQGTTSVAFAPGGATLAVEYANGRVYLWKTADLLASGAAATPAPAAILASPAGSKSAGPIAFGPGGTVLAAGGENGSTYVWDTTIKKITAILGTPNTAAVPGTSPAGDHEVRSLSFGPGGTTLAVGDDNGNAYLFDLRKKA